MGTTKHSPIRREKCKKIQSFHVLWGLNFPVLIPFSPRTWRMANAAEDFSQFGISKEVNGFFLSFHHPLLKMHAFWELGHAVIWILFQEKDKLVGEVIRYMLFKTHHNSGCPIKREELTQLVTKNYHQRNLPTFVINEAKDKLSTVFGYEMKELQRAHPSSKAQTRFSQQSEHFAFFCLFSLLMVLLGYSLSITTYVRNWIQFHL